MDKQNLEEINLQLKIVNNIINIENNPKYSKLEDFVLLEKVKERVLKNLKKNKLFIDVEKEWTEKIKEEYKELFD